MLLNVGLITYFNLDLILPKPVIVDAAIQPEKLQLLTEKELAILPKKEPVTAQASKATEPQDAAQSQLVCYKWGNFTKNNLPAAQVVLARLGLQSDLNQEALSQEDKRFWVYYPPLKSAALAQQKAVEIKALGISELFIVQDSQWRNAISFGLFQDEQLATNLLTELQFKGVKGATKALHNPGKSVTSLLIKAVSANAAQELQLVKPEFIGTELTTSDCPA